MIINRLSILPESQKNFDRAYLADARRVAAVALESASASDFRTHSYALQFLKYGKDDWTILRPKWKDVIDLPNFLPRDKGKLKRG